MLLEYFAHACFRLSAAGKRVLVDPYEERTGYAPPRREASVTLVSHDHFDHNNVSAVSGRTTVVRGAAAREVDSVPVKGVLVDHDRQGGSRLGLVTCFCWELGGLKICHLSDLGRPLTEVERREIGEVDLLLVPTGGGDYTIGPQEALDVVRWLAPRWAAPMHYMTPFLNRELFPNLVPVQDVLSGPFPVRRIHDSQVELSPEERTGETEILVLSHLF